MDDSDSPAMPALPEPICPLCGGPNHCVPARSANFSERCWCERATFPPELLAGVPESKAGRACICANCVASAAQRRQIS
jgi:Cysteine-rich CWC